MEAGGEISGYFNSSPPFADLVREVIVDPVLFSKLPPPMFEVLPEDETWNLPVVFVFEPLNDVLRAFRLIARRAGRHLITDRVLTAVTHGDEVVELRVALFPAVDALAEPFFQLVFLFFL